MAPVVMQDSVDTQTGAISAGQLVPIYSAFQWQPASPLMTPIGSGATATTLPIGIGGPAMGGAGSPVAPAYQPVQGGYAGVDGPTQIATQATVGAGVGPLAVNAQAGISSSLPGGTFLGVPAPLAIAVIGLFGAYLVLWKVHFGGAS